MMRVLYRFDEALLPECARSPGSDVMIQVSHVNPSIRTREFWFPCQVDLEWGRPDRDGRRRMSVRRAGDLFNEMVPFLRGFLVDLGIPALLLPDENLLVENAWEGCWKVDWPFVIDDDVWEAMYQIEPPPAIPSEMHRHGDVPMWDFGEKGRGQNATDLLLDRLPFSRILLQSTSSPESPTRIWSPTTCVDGSHTQNGTWEELLTAFFNRACVVRRSDLDDWKEKNVIRGRWLSPSEDEVEVYRLMGEPLPPLWDHDRFVQWILESHPSDESESGL